MAYAQSEGVPWHKLGAGLDEEHLDKDSIIQAAGLDWNVVCVPVYKHGKDRRYDRIPGRVAIERESDGKFYAMATEDYKPVQNSESADFLVKLGNGEAKFSAAGSLFEGRRVFFVSRFPDQTILGDVHHKYIVAFTSHDTTFDFTAFATSVRVVCWNTWQMALSEAKSQGALQVKARHTGDIIARLDKAGEMLAQALGLFDVMAEKLEILQDVPGDELLLPMTDFLFPLPKSTKILGPNGEDMTIGEPEKVPVTVRRMEENRLAFQNIYQQEQPTAAGLLQSVTGFADHYWRRQSGSNSIDERRMHDTFLGPVAEFKRKGIAKLTELAGVK